MGRCLVLNQDNHGRKNVTEDLRLGVGGRGSPFSRITRISMQAEWMKSGLKVNENLQQDFNIPVNRCSSSDLSVLSVILHRRVNKCFIILYVPKDRNPKWLLVIAFRGGFVKYCSGRLDTNPFTPFRFYWFKRLKIKFSFFSTSPF